MFDTNNAETQAVSDLVMRPFSNIIRCGGLGLMMGRLLWIVMHIREVTTGRLLSLDDLSLLHHR